jgi:hypothetical protein
MRDPGEGNCTGLHGNPRTKRTAFAPHAGLIGDSGGAVLRWGDRGDDNTEEGDGSTETICHPLCTKELEFPSQHCGTVGPFMEMIAKVFQRKPRAH